MTQPFLHLFCADRKTDKREQSSPDPHAVVPLQVQFLRPGMGQKFSLPPTTASKLARPQHVSHDPMPLPERSSHSPILHGVDPLLQFYSLHIAVRDWITFPAAAQGGANTIASAQQLLLLSPLLAQSHSSQISPVLLSLVHSLTRFFDPPEPLLPCLCRMVSEGGGGCAEGQRLSLAEGWPYLPLHLFQQQEAYGTSHTTEPSTML